MPGLSVSSCFVIHCVRHADEDRKEGGREGWGEGEGRRKMKRFGMNVPAYTGPRVLTRNLKPSGVEESIHLYCLWQSIVWLGLSGVITV